MKKTDLKISSDALTLKDLLEMNFRMLLSLIPEDNSTVRNMFLLAINKRTNFWYDDLKNMTTKEIQEFFNARPQYFV